VGYGIKSSQASKQASKQARRREEENRGYVICRKTKDNVEESFPETQMK
jgi:hypothetical protein